MQRLAPVLFCLAALGARADVDPASAAKIEKEREQAYADISKKHGDKKPSEMDNDERRAVIEEQKAAQKEVLEKNGTDEKEYAHYSARMNKEQRDDAKREREKLDDKDKAAAKPPAKKEIVVEKGLPEGEVDLAKSGGKAGGKHHAPRR